MLLSICTVSEGALSVIRECDNEAHMGAFTSAEAESDAADVEVTCPREKISKACFWLEFDLGYDRQARGRLAEYESELPRGLLFVVPFDIWIARRLGLSEYTL
jgi:hypothetical protein